MSADTSPLTECQAEGLKARGWLQLNGEWLRFDGDLLIVCRRGGHVWRKHLEEIDQQVPA
jgi:hypothetical protein